MKKVLVVGLLFASLAMIVVPSRGLAQQASLDIDALKAQIVALLAQVQQLQIQLNALSSGGFGTDVMAPGSTPTTLPGSSSGAFKSGIGLTVGARVQATDYVRVRLAANGTVAGTISPGTSGTVAGISRWENGYWWAEIYWDTRARGFSAEDFLMIVKQNLSNVCGDLNGDGTVNIQDTIWIGLYVTGGAPIPTGVNADVNGDGVVNVLDKTILENYALRGGVAPSCKNTQGPGFPSFKSPFPGEQWQAGMMHRFTWGGGDPNQQFLLAIEMGAKEYLLPAGRPLSVSEIGFNWNIPANFTPGVYRVVLFTPNDTLTLSDNIVLADQHFAVIPGQSTVNITLGSYAICGDIDGNSLINQNDLDNPASENDLTGYVFGGVAIPAGVNVDLNGDGRADILDVTVLTNHLNRGAAAPTCTAKVNNAPKITGLPSLPSRIEAGQSINLSWTATDVESDPLQWDITWGDGAVGACSTNCGNQYNGSHTWSQAGTYKVEAKAYDGKAWSAPHSFTIEVLPVTQKLVFGGSICGDVNQDGVITGADTTQVTDYAFGGVPIPVGVVADVNGDGVVDILDVTVMTNFVNRGGAAPTCGGVGAQAPTITSLTGPSLFSGSETRSWIVTAVDPEGSGIKYSVDWGDGEKSVSIYSGASGASVSLSHRYFGGKYVMMVTASDNTGLAATKFFVVESPRGGAFMDFYSAAGNSIGLTKGEGLVARDGAGVMAGFDTVLDGGGFLIHVFGDDTVTTPSVDEGMAWGEAVKFYSNGALCTVISGDNVWKGGFGVNSELALSCP